MSQKKQDTVWIIDIINLLHISHTYIYNTFYIIMYIYIYIVSNSHVVSVVIVMVMMF